MKEKLAAHLSTTYGSNPQIVQAKIEREMFDWNQFDPFTCTIGAVPTNRV